MRWHLGLSLGVGFLVAGCSQSALPPSARIIGTNGLVQVGDLLFVTSTDRAELRALDLKPAKQQREFVRAPNPLEPLAIPVLDRPVALARDLRYDSAGQEVGGPYLYAQAEAAPEISIVGSDRATQLVELARLPTQGIVTAIAAQGAAAGQPSTLYYATVNTLNGTEGQLWRLPIPSPDPSGRISAPIGAPVRATLVGYGPGGSPIGDPITALLLLPDNRLVVASRNAGNKRGRTIVLDPAVPAQQTELTFASSCGPNGNQPCPVRLLATHPTVVSESGRTLKAGDRVFGVLDEDACSGGALCTGILAVDAARDSGRVGQVSLDIRGSPMVPLTFGSVLPTGVTLAPNTQLVVTGTDFPTFTLLGIVSLSNGLIYFVDAGALRYIDLGPAFAGEGAKATGVGYLDATSGRPYVPGPKFDTIQVAHGAGLDETVKITYQGTITGLQDLPTNGGSNRLSVSGSLATRVMRADIVTLTNCQPAETSVLDITAPEPGSPNATLIVRDVIQQCTGASTFSVRAAGGMPYVVEGVDARPIRLPSGNMGSSGYMGRTSNGTATQDQTFVFPSGDATQRAARYYFHPDSFNPADPQPQLQFKMGPGDPNIQRDWFYAITTVSNFDPEFMYVDPSYGVEYHLPATSVYVGTLPSSGDPVNRLFVAYPSANAILEFNPAGFVPNRANFRYISAYR